MTSSRSSWPATGSAKASRSSWNQWRELQIAISLLSAMGTASATCGWPADMDAQAASISWALLDSRLPIMRQPTSSFSPACMSRSRWPHTRRRPVGYRSSQRASAVWRTSSPMGGTDGSWSGMPGPSPPSSHGWKATHPSARQWGREPGCRASGSAGSRWSSRTFGSTETLWTSDREGALRTADPPEVQAVGARKLARRSPRLHLLAVSHPCIVPINQDFFAHVEEETGWTVTIVLPLRWTTDYGKNLKPARWPRFQGRLLPLPVRLAGSVPLHFYSARLGRVLDRMRPDAIYVHNEPYAAATYQVFRASYGLDDV